MILVGKELSFFAIVWFFTRVIILEFKHADALLSDLPAERYQQWLGDGYLLSEIWLKAPVGDE